MSKFVCRHTHMHTAHTHTHIPECQTLSAKEPYQSEGLLHACLCGCSADQCRHGFTHTYIHTHKHTYIHTHTRMSNALRRRAISEWRPAACEPLHTYTHTYTHTHIHTPECQTLSAEEPYQSEGLLHASLCGCSPGQCRHGCTQVRTYCENSAKDEESGWMDRVEEGFQTEIDMIVGNMTGVCMCVFVCMWAYIFKKNEGSGWMDRVEEGFQAEIDMIVGNMTGVCVYVCVLSIYIQVKWRVWVDG
jgi:hypothetical protein